MIDHEYGEWVDWPGKPGKKTRIKSGRWCLASASLPIQNRSVWTVVLDDDGRLVEKEWPDWERWVKAYGEVGREYRAFWYINPQYFEIIRRSNEGLGFMSKTYIRRDFPYGPFTVMIDDE